MEQIHHYAIVVVGPVPRKNQARRTRRARRSISLDGMRRPGARPRLQSVRAYFSSAATVSASVQLSSAAVVMSFNSRARSSVARDSSARASLVPRGAVAS